MSKLGGVFYFTFSLEDEEDNDGNVPQLTFGFNLTPKAIELLGEDFAGDEWMEEVFWDIEGEFGVHDWCTYPVDEVVGVGYNTYEVSRELAPECVERWRQEFVKRVGAENVSVQVYNLGSTTFDSDLDVFKAIEGFQVKE